MVQRALRVADLIDRFCLFTFGCKCAAIAWGLFIGSTVGSAILAVWAAH